MRAARIFRLAFILLLALPLPALAGAWTLPQDRWEVNLSGFIYRTDEFFDASGERRSQQEFRKYELHPFVEYGYSDELTLGFKTFLHRVEQDGASISGNYGIADTELFARYQFYKNDSAVLSVQPLLKLPSYYHEDTLPKGGSEEGDGEMRLLGGYSFPLWGQYHYINAEAAYRYRAGSLRDQWRADISLGMRITDTILIIPTLYATFSTDLPSNPTFRQDGQQDYDLIKLELNSMIDVTDQLYLSGGLFTHLDGRNSGGGEGLRLGVGYRF